MLFFASLRLCVRFVCVPMNSPLRPIILLLCCSLFPFITGISLAGSAEALQDLEKISFFPFGGIGVAGSRSTGGTLFLQLAKDRTNAGLFHSLWKGGTNEAKCCALLGRDWPKDPDADRFAQTLASGHISVTTAHE